MVLLNVSSVMMFAGRKFSSAHSCMCERKAGSECCKLQQAAARGKGWTYQGLKNGFMTVCAIAVLSIRVRSGGLAQPEATGEPSFRFLETAQARKS